MYDYNLLESDEPASIEQLNELSEKEGWKLQILLQYDQKFYFHFVREKCLPTRTISEYLALKASSPIPSEQLTQLAEERWLVQATFVWKENLYYYFTREKLSIATSLN
jgi:hypothetical protein